MKTLEQRGSNPCIGILMSTALKHAGLPPRDPYQPGRLLSLGKAGLADELFRTAGFRDVATTAIPAPFRLPCAADYLDFVRSSAGPIQQILGGRQGARWNSGWTPSRRRPLGGTQRIAADRGATLTRSGAGAFTILAMGWHARLALDYRLENGRCVARAEHEGPMRILQTLYPEGDAVAHNVLVHPPGGLVGGDTLEISVRAGPGSHALVTTPGAARFYRSMGEPAVQTARIVLAAGARCEWLPLEAICYSGCLAENRLALDLAPDAELIGWDVTAFGLPASQLPFEKGSLRQHLELKQGWLERGRIDALDARLLDGALGLAGNRCLGTLFLATGTPLSKPRREQALELANNAIAAQGTAAFAGATAPGSRVVVVRALAPQVEPALALLKAVRAAWRPALWNLPPTVPRSWAM